MTQPEQTEAFMDDLTRLIARYCAEFELTTASAIGVLEIKKHELIAHGLAREDDDTDEGETV
jgi:hypothetical protein